MHDNADYDQSKPRESWPLALQAVFGVVFESPDEFVAWAEQQSLSWLSPSGTLAFQSLRSLSGHSDPDKPHG